MKMPRLFARFWKCSAAVMGVIFLSACEPPKPTVEIAAPEIKEATPVTPSEPASLAASPVEEVALADEVVGAVEAPEEVNMDPADLENQRVKEEVLKRIDVMPALSSSDKDRLYVQVERARSMGKVITIPFPTGGSRIPASVISELGASLQQPQVRALTDDPTVVFVVLGFADKQGNADKNIEISTRRADSVLAAIRDQFKVLNVMHSVGMGSSEMFDAESLDKNRVVEVWAVLP